MNELTVTPLTGGMSPFSADRFVGTLVRAGVPAELALRNGELVHGLLLGRGTTSISTDALRGMTAEIVAHPQAPDLSTLASLVDHRLSPKPIVLGVPMVFALAKRAAGAMGADLESRLVMLTTLDAVLDDRRQVHRTVAFGLRGDGALQEYASGGTRKIATLGLGNADEVIPTDGQSLRSSDQVLAMLAPLHPSWVETGGLWFRNIALTTISTIAPQGGDAIVRPVYLCSALTQDEVTIAIVEAATGTLLLHTSIWTWAKEHAAEIAEVAKRDAELVAKFLLLDTLVDLIVGTISGGALGSETVIISLAAAMALALEICAAGILIARILMEIFGDDPHRAADVQRCKDAIVRLKRAEDEARAKDWKKAWDDLRNAFSELTTASDADADAKKVQGTIQKLAKALEWLAAHMAP